MHLRIHLSLHQTRLLKDAAEEIVTCLAGEPEQATWRSIMRAAEEALSHHASKKAAREALRKATATP
jgi:hypothetical protein